MATIAELVGAEPEAFGPQTRAFLMQKHPYYADLALAELLAFVIAERRIPQDSPPPELPKMWAAGALALLLGQVIDAHKAGALTPERAEQFRVEARAAQRPKTLLRLLVVLFHETHPQAPTP